MSYRKFNKNVLWLNLWILKIWISNELYYNELSKNPSLNYAISALGRRFILQ